MLQGQIDDTERGQPKYLVRMLWLSIISEKNSEALNNSWLQTFSLKGVLLKAVIRLMVFSTTRCLNNLQETYDWPTRHQDRSAKILRQTTGNWTAWHHLTDIADFNMCFPDILVATLFVNPENGYGSKNIYIYICKQNICIYIYIHIHIHNIWLVVYLPLWKMMEFVSIPNCVESHKIPCFQQCEAPSDFCWFRFAPVTSSLFAYH